MDHEPVNYHEKHINYLITSILLMLFLAACSSSSATENNGTLTPETNTVQITDTETKIMGADGVVSFDVSINGDLNTVPFFKRESSIIAGNDFSLRQLIQPSKNDKGIYKYMVETSYGSFIGYVTYDSNTGEVTFDFLDGEILDNPEPHYLPTPTPVPFTIPNGADEI